MQYMIFIYFTQSHLHSYSRKRSLRTSAITKTWYTKFSPLWTVRYKWKKSWPFDWSVWARFQQYVIKRRHSTQKPDVSSHFHPQKNKCFGKFNPICNPGVDACLMNLIFQCNSMTVLCSARFWPKPHKITILVIRTFLYLLFEYQIQKVFSVRRSCIVESD